MRLFSVLIICFLLASCSEKKNDFFKILNAGNLPVQEFSFTNDRDTSLFTQEGIRIHVEANSFSSSPVKIEIKEALTISDMIRGGLITMSDDEILSSDGMFNIAVKAGGDFKKSIRVDIPKHAADMNMKLFKGEEDHGTINWTSPEELTIVNDEKVNTSGKNLFESNCRSCHSNKNQTLVGPSLIGVQNIRAKQWLYAFTRNSSCMVQCDPLACCLFHKYGKAPMPDFPSLTDDKLDSLYAYISREAISLGFGADYKPYSECDSCQYYQQKIYNLEHERDSLIDDNGTLVQTTGVGTTEFDNGTLPKVDPPKTNAVYYAVTVKAQGWYNVDVMMRDVKTAEQSELKVNVTASDGLQPSVMLVIPSQKSFSEGGKLDNSDEYGFQGTDGKIFLTQKVVAYILVYAEQDGKIYFGSQKFKTAITQDIQVTLMEVSKRKLEMELHELHLEDMKFDVKETKNASSIKEIDASLIEFKKHTENCNCGDAVDTASESFLKESNFNLSDPPDKIWFSEFDSMSCDCGQISSTQFLQRK